MKVIQIFLPLKDNVGEKFPSLFFAEVKTDLMDQFDGLTIFTQSPATGLWEDGDHEVIHDENVIFEVMTEKFDQKWWCDYRQHLETHFRQDRIIIRIYNVILA